MAKNVKGAASKETQAADAKADAVKPEEILEAVTGTLTLYSVEVDEDANPIDEKVLTVSKGKTEAGAVKYQAACNGVSGAIKGTIAAAINSLLVDGLKLLPAAWAVPKNEKDVVFPEKGNNKPKEPETLDDLSAEMQAEMRADMSALSAEVAEYRDAENRTRQSVRKVAERVRDLRLAYSKAEFGIFCRLADAGSEVAKLLTAKNTLGEFVFFANIPADLLAVMPEGKASPKAAQAWVNGLRGNVASAIVNAIKVNKDLAGVSVSEAVRKVSADHFAGEEPIAFDGEQEAHTVLWDIHASSLDLANTVGALFDVDSGGKLSPARDDGKHVTSSVFGTEGADELVKAIANAFNGYVSAADKAAIGEMRAKTKAIATRDFNTLSPDEVARHLFNIMAGRVDDTTDETLETTVGDCLAVVDKLGGWFDAIAAGTMTVADVLATGEKPESEDDAESDADATA